MDEVAERIERSKSWIVREALSQWPAEEQRRHDLTVEALKDVDEGRVLSSDKSPGLGRAKESKRALVDWREQRELRDVDVERPAVLIDHPVASAHRA